MPAETIFPAWFRRLPLFATMERDARIADETQRAELRFHEQTMRVEIARNRGCLRR